MSNILYYSKRCQHCKSMIVNISQSPVKSQIQFVCVDDLIKNGNLPSFIKSVPTIFKKDTNTLLKGDSATEWIRSFNQTEDSVGDDIGGFGGFGNFGGAYSGLSEDGGYGGSFSTGDTYSFIGNSEQGQEQGQQGNNAPSSKSDMKSEKKQLMDNAYEKLMSERESIGRPIART